MYTNILKFHSSKLDFWPDRKQMEALLAAGHGLDGKPISDEEKADLTSLCQCLDKIRILKKTQTTHKGWQFFTEPNISWTLMRWTDHHALDAWSALLRQQDYWTEYMRAREAMMDRYDTSLTVYFSYALGDPTTLAEVQKVCAPRAI